MVEWEARDISILLSTNNLVLARDGQKDLQWNTVEEEWSLGLDWTRAEFCQADEKEGFQENWKWLKWQNIAYE